MTSGGEAHDGRNPKKPKNCALSGGEWTGEQRIPQMCPVEGASGPSINCKNLLRVLSIHAINRYFTPCISAQPLHKFPELSHITSPWHNFCLGWQTHCIGSSYSAAAWVESVFTCIAGQWPMIVISRKVMQSHVLTNKCQWIMILLLCFI